uniref:5'-nucleotidase n=1 Tax=Mucochytrium quahogii TaxID=96639 RepID=A0A7S2RNM4_9STRA|mmetsp:Transcript_960/g.1524  ORF Transcript_960/g.1524 Transcript_960/m.1524 type:complete len:357 (+) Transcript_960:138-1208(+)
MQTGSLAMTKCARFGGLLGGLGVLWMVRCRSVAKRGLATQAKGGEEPKAFEKDQDDRKYEKGAVEICNPSEFDAALDHIAKGGHEHLRVVIDFDYTMTTFWDENGNRGHSCHAVLEDCGLLPDSYHAVAQALQKKYFPLEISNEITHEEKYKYMVEWVEQAEEALIDSGLRKEHIPIAVKKANLRLRDGVPDFLKRLEKANIPVLIFSAGIADILEEYLRQQKLLLGNVTVVSNHMVFDDDGVLVGFEAKMQGREPFHVFNKKYEYVSQDRKDYLKSVWGDDGRLNVLLLGDSQGDVHMSDGMIPNHRQDDHRELRIGFLNHHIKDRLSVYKSKYSALILNDGDFSFVNAILDKVL